MLSKLAGPLMKISVSLAINTLAPLGITAAASAIDAGIQKKIHGSGTTTLIISNKQMNYIIKIVQALEDSEILLKGVTKTIKNEKKEQERGSLSLLLSTLGTSLLGNILAGKGIVWARSGRCSLKSYKKGKGIVRTGYGKKRMGFLMPTYPLINFEIQKYYENEPRFNGVYSRNNLPTK